MVSTIKLLKQIADNTARPPSQGMRFRNAKWVEQAAANTIYYYLEVPTGKEIEIQSIFVSLAAVDVNNRYFNVLGYPMNAGQDETYYAMRTPVFTGSQYVTYFPGAPYTVTAGDRWILPLPSMRYYEGSTIQLVFDCEVNDVVRANIFYTEYDS